MNFINRCVAVLLLLLPITANACFPAKVSIQQRVTAAQQIYLGLVTNVVYAADDEETHQVINAVSQPAKAYSLDVSVIEMVKGSNEQSTIQPQILNCGSGKAALNDKVIVFLSDGFWYTVKFEQNYYSKLLSLTK